MFDFLATVAYFAALALLGPNAVGQLPFGDPAAPPPPPGYTQSIGGIPVSQCGPSW